jgi:hypothetical protein
MPDGSLASTDNVGIIGATVASIIRLFVLVLEKVFLDFRQHSTVLSVATVRRIGFVGLLYSRVCGSA